MLNGISYRKNFWGKEDLNFDKCTIFAALQFEQGLLCSDIKKRCFNKH